MQQQVQQRASEHEQDLRAMSEQVCEWDRVSPSLPPSLIIHYTLTNVCVQLTVAREQATHAELKLYDVALEMHEKMTNQRDQLTSLFEVHMLS